MNKQSLRTSALAAALLSLAFTTLAGELPKTRIALPDEPQEKNPTRYYTELAQVHMKYKVYDKAEEYLKKAIELEQNAAATADCAAQLARLYLEWGKKQEALMMFEFAVAQTPDTPSLLNRSREMIRAYESIGELDKAEAACLKAIEKAEGPMKSHMEKEYFLLCQKSGKLGKLIEQKEKQAAEDPRNAQLFSNLAYLYRLAGEKEKELDAYRRLVETNPQDYQALAQLAVAFRNAGQPDKAIECYEKLIDLNPNARPYYVSEIVKLYAQAGNIEQAEQWARQMMDEKEMATPAGQARASRLYQDMGMLDKAVEHCKAAIELAPEPQQKELYQLQLARLLYQAKQYAQAAEVCDRLTKESRNPSTQQEAKALLIRIKKEQGQAP
ncbi:MAG TPA: tetratricopeptide repeat protein [Planctomycetota bacterium]|nr:tetratricopeptide repeat protein [Planctomycetota bacterium]